MGKSFEVPTIRIEQGGKRSRQYQTMRMINPKRLLFVPIPIWLFRMGGVSWTAKVLYGRIALYANEKGEAWPSQETLAGEFGMTTSGVRKLVRQLKDARVLATKKRGLGQTVVYVFLEHPAMWDEEWDSFGDDGLPRPIECPGDVENKGC